MRFRFETNIKLLFELNNCLQMLQKSLEKHTKDFADLDNHHIKDVLNRKENEI